MLTPCQKSSGREICMFMGRVQNLPDHKPDLLLLQHRAPGQCPFGRLGMQFMKPARPAPCSNRLHGCWLAAAGIYAQDINQLATVQTRLGNI